MKKELIRSLIIFIVVVSLVVYGLNFIFNNKNGPSSRAAGETMSLAFNPGLVTPTLNQDFTVSLVVKPSISTVLRGYRLRVNFDKTKLKFKSLTYKLGVVSAGLGNTVADLTAINTKGYINLVGEDQSQTGVAITAASGAEIASLTFTALKTDPAALSVVNANFYTVNIDHSLFDGWTISATDLNINGGTSTCQSFSDDFNSTIIAPVITTNTVGFWHLDEGTGTGAYLKDASSYGNDLTPTGTSLVGGLIGNARNFNGTSDYLSIAAGATSSLNINTGPVTMSAWIRPNSVTTAQGIISRGTQSTNGYGLRLNSTGKINLGSHGGGNFDGATTLVVGKWYYVTGVVNGANSAIYINGKLDKTGTVAAVTSTGDFLIGADNTGTAKTAFFHGIIDDAQVLKTAQSAADIINTYNSIQNDYNANYWNFWTNNGGSSTTAGGEATLYLPVTTATGKGTTFDTFDKRNFTGGDFSTELTLKSLSATAGKKSGESLLAYGATTNDSRLVQITRRTGDTHIYAEVDNQAGDGGWTEQNKDIGLTDAMPVKVKIERIGNTINTYYDLIDGKGYQLIRAYNNFYNGPGRVYFGVFSLAPDYPQSSAKFDDFSLKCGTSTISPTPVVTGNTTLNLKLKFSGMTSKPPDAVNKMNVKVTISGGSITSPIVTRGNFVADATGVWSGSVNFDLPSTVGGKYTIMIKGAKQLQKKICDNAPTETSPGTYKCSNANISLVVGANNLDFSNILILSGDIYSSNKDQDDVISSLDLQYIKNNLNTKDATTIGICDVNLDGKCDSQDYSVTISALSFKSGDSL